MKYSRVVLPLAVLIFAFTLGLSHAGMDETARLRLIKTMSGSVVGVNSAVLKPEELLTPDAYKGSGSGVIVDDMGHVATLRNLIADTHAVEIILNDGTTWPAIFKGEDRETGIAILTVQAPEGLLKKLPRVKFGSSGRWLTGQDVLAMGRTSGGEQLLVAQGLVSCSGRTLLSVNGGVLYDVLELDRLLAPSLEGGGLFDNTGRLIGLVAGSLVKKGNSAEWSDFALPASTVSWVAQRIIEDGRVVRARLGVDLVTISPALAKFLGLPVTRGALVTAVSPGGPAEKAGLKGSQKTLRLGNRVYPVGGDIIVGLGRSEIRSDTDVVLKLREYRPGDKALVTIYRGSRRMRLKVTLGSR